MNPKKIIRIIFFIKLILKAQNSDTALLTHPVYGIIKKLNKFTLAARADVELGVLAGEVPDVLFAVKVVGLLAVVAALVGLALVGAGLAVNGFVVGAVLPVDVLGDGVV